MILFGPGEAGTGAAAAAVGAPVAGAGGPVPIEKDLRIALGLLLKHRGGPGYGHGRLDGRELTLMEGKLRDVAQRLAQEAGVEAL